MLAGPKLNLAPSRRTVLAGLLAAGDRFGADRVAIIDGDEKAYSYGAIIRAAFALGSALKRGTARRENVGVLLPTGIAAVMAFFALQTVGRIPAMLNFTAGAKSLVSACTTAQVKTVVSARKFIELASLSPLVEALSASVRFVYLEDLRAQLRLVDKLTAAIAPFFPWLFRAHANPDGSAVILFTSGTEGEPKGVALSHAALLANVEQVKAHIDFYPSDIVLNPLPTFHCFGLTVGALMPLMLGLKSVQHPSPLQARTIAKRVRATGATILLATDTFLSQYARAGDQGDLNSLRLAVCGAERVRDETRQIVRRKYNLEILEGYGVTETAPVAAANQPGANRSGTVGRLIAGMEARLEPVEGIEGAGRLFLKGPNVMRGYLSPSEPGVIKPPADGWHDTGDIVSIDDEGYITIRGRMKRFAKIGGEMISLAVVENCASALWPDNMHAAVAVPDGRKGEQIVLLTDCADAKRSDLVGWVRNHGVSELAVPRRIFTAASIPLLGTGKTDYAKVTAEVHTRLSETAAAEQG